MPKYIFFDTETGGLDTSFSLLTFYAAITNDKFKVIDELSLKLKPEDGAFKCSERALAVNKIKLEDHSKIAITYSEGSDILRRFLEKHSLEEKLRPAGQNPLFDIGFINQYLMDKKEWEKYCRSIPIDTVVIAEFLCDVGAIPDSSMMSRSLGKLAEFYGIRVRGDLHNEKTDVIINIEVYKHMVEDAMKRRKLITEI
jgi:DNA polymerase III epsilon subunit-like protein